MDSTFSRSSDAYAVEMDGEYVMMGREQGAYFSLADVAAAIWEELETPKSLQQLVDSLLTKFDVTPDECKRETSIFLDELLDNGLVIAL